MGHEVKMERGKFIPRDVCPALYFFVILAFLATVPSMSWAGSEGKPWRVPTHKSHWYNAFFPAGQRLPPSRLSDEPLPFADEYNGGIPSRPPLHLELGDRFLDSGKLYRGFTLPGRM